MGDLPEKNGEDHEEEGLHDRISGLGQKLIGEIEAIGGIVTGDPITAAEGEFNIEVGEAREEIEEDLEEERERNKEKSGEGGE